MRYQVTSAMSLMYFNYFSFHRRSNRNMLAHGRLVRKQFLYFCSLATEENFAFIPGRWTQPVSLCQFATLGSRFTAGAVRSVQ